MCGVKWPCLVKYRGELVAAHHSRDTSRRDTTRTVRRLLGASGRLAGICLGKRMASIAPYRTPSEFCLSKNRVRVSFALGDPLSPRRATADKLSPHACGQRQESGEPSPYLEKTSNELNFWGKRSGRTGTTGTHYAITRNQSQTAGLNHR
jgi:hypothetical protein